MEEEDINANGAVGGDEKDQEPNANGNEPTTINISHTGATTRDMVCKEDMNIKVHLTSTDTLQALSNTSLPQGSTITISNTGTNVQNTLTCERSVNIIVGNSPITELRDILQARRSRPPSYNTATKRARNVNSDQQVPTSPRPQEPTLNPDMDQ